MNRFPALAFATLAALAVAAHPVRAGAACISTENDGPQFDWGEWVPSQSGFQMHGFFDPLTGHTRVYGMTTASSSPSQFKGWDWDGFAWTPLDTTALTQQLGIGFITGLAFDPTRRTVLISATLGFSRAYVFNLDTPDQITRLQDGVGPFANTIWSVYAPDEDVFYVYSPTVGLGRFDPAVSTIMLLHSPVADLPAVNATDVVYDPIHRRLVYFGGAGGDYRTFVYSFDDNTFLDVTNASTPPTNAPRNTARMVFNPSAGDVTLIVPRYDSASPTPHDQLYRLTADNQWQPFFATDILSDGTFWYPPATVFDAARNEVVVFGGRFRNSVSDLFDNDTTPRIVFDAPALAFPPHDVTAATGLPATLQVVPSEHARFTAVRWYKDGALVAMTPAPFLELPSVQPDMAGEWTVELAGSCGSTLSQPFTLTVTSAPITCPADTDGNSVINFADLNAVLGAFGQPCTP